MHLLPANIAHVISQQLGKICNADVLFFFFFFFDQKLGHRGQGSLLLPLSLLWLVLSVVFTGEGKVTGREELLIEQVENTGCMCVALRCMCKHRGKHVCVCVHVASNCMEILSAIERKSSSESINIVPKLFMLLKHKNEKLYSKLVLTDTSKETVNAIQPWQPSSCLQASATFLDSLTLPPAWVRSFTRGQQMAQVQWTLRINTPEPRHTSGGLQ